MWNIIWGLYYTLDQQTIEKIQRATKLLVELYDAPYFKQLAIFILSSLQYHHL